MGYGMTNGKISISGSDLASDEMYSLASIIVKQLRGTEDEDNAPYNTDGMVNVGLILNEAFLSSRFWLENCEINAYAKKFAERFSEYIENQKDIPLAKDGKMGWTSQENKDEHISFYKGLLDEIRRKLNVSFCP